MTDVTPLSPGAGMKLTVLILTRNEESCIARAIGSVGFADEILVLDSESTDRTREIATTLGARVEVQSFLGWGRQHRRGATLAKHDWILWLDADEIVTPELARSIRLVMRTGANPRDGFVVQRQDEFLGQLMPDMRRRAKRLNFVRLFNRKCSDWNAEQLVHEEVEVPGRRIMMEGMLLHWRNYTVDAQLLTLNRNADLEARMLQQVGRGTMLTLVIKPILRFGWIFVISGCWRFGARGFIWAGLHATGEFLRQAKGWELRHSTPQPHPPRSLYAGPLSRTEILAFGDVQLPKPSEP